MYRFPNSYFPNVKIPKKLFPKCPDSQKVISHMYKFPNSYFPNVQIPKKVISHMCKFLRTYFSNVDFQTSQLYLHFPKNPSHSAGSSNIFLKRN